ncbi:hypothetical protein Poly30_34690 [Planctomycetes bacterium Poly30]|uniref:DUF1565 domain-containing protein n=1 Tax=Saltatorellus ferox TaxID=2528018 RepID=A0A518EV16_9BACT|nr:hypothetical protein Poly30_34690 [Planctomycetes bacterium Poly30]
MRASLFAVALSLASLPSAWCQSRVYVDASLGDDTNPGTEVAPFRTLTRATGFIAAATATSFDRYQIVASPGVHNAALGEVFPIHFASNVTLTPGVAGSRVIIDGDRTPVAVVVDGEDPVAPNKGIRGLTVRDAETGILIGDGSPDFFVRYLIGCSVEDCDLGLDAASLVFAFPIDVQWSSGEVLRCFRGVQATGDRWISLYDMEFSDTVANAIECSGIRLLTVDQGEIAGGDHAVAMSAGSSPSEVRVTSSVITGFVAGVLVTGSAGSHVPRFTVDHATLTGNTAAFSLQGAFDPSSVVRRSVFVQNSGAFDSSGQGGLMVEDSLVDSSAVAGAGLLVPGPLPTFVHAAGGDYNLRRSSPAVDALPSTAQDPNPTDGNLDTVGGRDMGALQLETLVGPLEAQIGTTLVLTTLGEPVGSGFGILQPRFSTGAVQMTPYGLLRVEPGLAMRVARILPAPGTGVASWSVAIPNDLSLVGEIWVLQALTPSSAAPQGFAFTNELSIRIRL